MFTSSVLGLRRRSPSVASILPEETHQGANDLRDRREGGRQDTGGSGKPLQHLRHKQTEPSFPRGHQAGLHA